MLIKAISLSKHAHGYLKVLHKAVSKSGSIINVVGVCVLTWKMSGSVGQGESLVKGCSVGYRGNFPENRGGNLAMEEAKGNEVC